MPRAPRPDDPADTAGAGAAWAGEAQAAPVPPPGASGPSQLPLFHADDPAHPRVRRARLRTRLKALLAARLKRRTEPPASGGQGQPGSSWPDSFFGP
jgi:hypothetical protein